MNSLDIPVQMVSNKRAYSYNGIMFAKKIGDGAWEINLLNDGSKVNKNFVKTKYLPSLMLLRGR